MKLSFLKTCPVCLRDFLTSSTTKVTCARPCARVMAHAEWWFHDDTYEEGRIHLVRQILDHPERHTRSQLRWASRMMSTYLRTGEVPPPGYRFMQKDSIAHQVMLEAMGEEGIADVLARATRETVK